MLKRLVYEKVQSGRIEKLTVPIFFESEISTKANILMVLCEAEGVTHNFRLQCYCGEEDGWAEGFIPQAELDKVL